MNAFFFLVVAPALVARCVRSADALLPLRCTARDVLYCLQDHQPCVIFMDEIDAIGGSRFSEGTSADR